MRHQPLQVVAQGEDVVTGGRLARENGRWILGNAHRRLLLEAESAVLQAASQGDLVRVRGRLEDEVFFARQVELVFEPGFKETGSKETALVAGREFSLGEAVVARSAMNAEIRGFFADRGFLEAETPAFVPAPGTDIYLSPFETSFGQPDAQEQSRQIRGYLHTSPEFAMKRLLAEGFERIYQLGHVWRNGEVTDLHNPEFTILEWYRAWEGVEAIVDDVEELTRRVLHGVEVTGLDEPFLRMTMQEVFFEACGFDLLDALEADRLREEILRHELLDRLPSPTSRWDELFFELIVTHVDDFLKELGPVFVTEWPAPLAVLAGKKEADPRVAERFELYIDGIELANGFGELTDPGEQRARFEEDLRERRDLGLPELPMPHAFLEALEFGLPPSSGVAMGVDRLLMLRTGQRRIREVIPFALRRDPVSGKIRW